MFTLCDSIIFLYSEVFFNWEFNRFDHQASHLIVHFTQLELTLSGAITWWSLGDMAVVLKVQYLNTYHGLSSQACLVKLPSGECYRTPSTDYKFTLVRVMAWGHQPTSNFLSQCWSRSMLPLAGARPHDCPCYKLLNCEHWLSIILQLNFHQQLFHDCLTSIRLASKYVNKSEASLSHCHYPNNTNTSR